MKNFVIPGKSCLPPVCLWTKCHVAHDNINDEYNSEDSVHDFKEIRSILGDAIVINAENNSVQDNTCHDNY